MALLEEPIKEVKVLKNYIDGEWVESKGEVVDVVNPATMKTISQVPISTREEIDAAVAAAQAAYPDWRRTTPLARTRMLFRLKELLEENFEKASRIQTQEHGKCIDESRGESRRGIENVEVACGIPTLMQGYVSEDVAHGIDVLVVRELTGGIYFGEPKGVEARDGQRVGYSTMVYMESEVRRIAKVAFEAARKRGKRVCSVDKANVLDVSRLWREIVIETHTDYPDVELSHMYVDNAAMQLVRDPNQFDVMVTGNLFGDILSDEAGCITGSIGMLPSASLGESGPGLYEPIHGSAPDIAGTDAANPLATIMSVAMLLRHTLGLTAEADAVERAVSETLTAGLRTGDIGRADEPGVTMVGCKAMGEAVAGRIARA